MVSKTYVLGIVAVSLMVACAEPKKSRGQASARGARGGSTVIPGGGTDETQTTALCDGRAWGVIYDESTPQQTWQEKVNRLVSVSGAKVGEVSHLANSPTGISFCGRVCPSNNSLSALWVGIYDSLYVDGKDDTLINIGISQGGARNGRVQGGGNTVTFSDDMGFLTFQGSQSGSEMVGTVAFQNKGDSAPTTLGKFRIPYSEFIRCN